LLLFVVSNAHLMAQEKDAVPSLAGKKPNALTLPGLNPYQGEITDEMLGSFIRADSRIRALRQEIWNQTQEILLSEDLPSDVYVAIILKLRQDPNFLGRMRQKAAEMVDVGDSTE